MLRKAFWDVRSLGRLAWFLDALWLAPESFGYRIFAVSKQYTSARSLTVVAAELGSPPTTTIVLPTAVILCPDLGEGEGPMF